MHPFVRLHDKLAVCRHCHLPTTFAFCWPPWQLWYLPDYKVGTAHSMMVQDKTWWDAGLNPHRLMMENYWEKAGDFLHQRCLEKRLGRKLTVEDLDLTLPSAGLS